MSFAYEEKAVAALAAALGHASTGIVAQLRAIELADGLTPNTLPDPEMILDYEAPADPRSPLVQVFDAGQENTGAEYRNRLSGVDCTVGLTYNSDADLSAAERYMRRLMRAVRMCVAANPTLSSQVGQAWTTDANRTLTIQYDSSTRHARYMGVNVRVHDP